MTNKTSTQMESAENERGKLFISINGEMNDNNMESDRYVYIAPDGTETLVPFFSEEFNRWLNAINHLQDMKKSGISVVIGNAERMYKESWQNFRKKCEAEVIDGLLNNCDVVITINSIGGNSWMAESINQFLKMMKERGASVHCYVANEASSAAADLLKHADQITMTTNTKVLWHTRSDNTGKADVKYIEEDTQAMQEYFERTVLHYKEEFRVKLDEVLRDTENTDNTFIMGSQDLRRHGVVQRLVESISDLAREIVKDLGIDPSNDKSMTLGLVRKFARYKFFENLKKDKTNDALNAIRSILTKKKNSS